MRDHDGGVCGLTGDLPCMIVRYNKYGNEYSN